MSLLGPAKSRLGGQHAPTHADVPTHTVQTSAASRLLTTASPDGPQQLCAPSNPPAPQAREKADFGPTLVFQGRTAF